MNYEEEVEYGTLNDLDDYLGFWKRFGIALNLRYNGMAFRMFRV